MWIAVVAGGVFALAKHSATPGRPAGSQAGPLAPVVSEAASGQMTLVMFVHPQCPCSAASVEELSQLMARCGPRVNASVVVFQSTDESEAWNHSTIWARASGITGVNVRPDPDGAVAKQAGARTSGQVFLYGTDGALLFSGGITGSRGHVGNNDGLDALTELVLGERSPGPWHATGPVFGCALESTPERGDALVSLQRTPRDR